MKSRPHLVLYAVWTLLMITITKEVEVHNSHNVSFMYLILIINFWLICGDRESGTGARQPLTPNKTLFRIAELPSPCKYSHCHCWFTGTGHYVTAA